jgi:hypothetical protein
MTPNKLARELGYSGVAIRRWLRNQGRRPESAKWSRWDLTAEDVRAIRDAFPARTSATVVLRPSEQVPQAPVIGKEWEYEGSVVAAVARFLVATGWSVEFIADTRSRQQGDDIRARLGERTLRVEAKGWPSDDYADPRRSTEKKRTNPNTQAVHWYATALLRVVRDLGLHPDHEVAIALPDKPRYRVLLSETEASLRGLGIGVFIVCPDGKVEEHVLSGRPGTD